MTKKFTNIEVEEIISKLDAPDSICNTKDPSKKLSIKLLWKIETNRKRLATISEQMHTMRDSIIASYSTDEKSVEETLESGEVIRKVKSEYLEDWQNELKELGLVENDVEIDTISITEIENLDMVPGDFATIKFMVEE